MKLRDFVKFGVAATALAAVFGCSRDHIKAVELANAGDRAVKVNPDGAIGSYEQAIQLDPTNHRILWKLAKAYEKKEEWDKMASTLSRAVQLAPDHANYWFKRGYSLVMQAEGGNPDAWEQAKEPLSKCIEKDPNFAECYHFLGVAQVWTDEEQQALDSLTKAAEHDARVAYFYPPLAELYITLKFFDEAGKVLDEGTRLIPPTTDKNKEALYGMYSLMFKVRQQSDDKPAMLAAMEKAKDVAGSTHPEVSFNLGSTYAVMDPPRKEKAVRLLNSFTKRACRGANAAKFKDQCTTASTLIQKLGG